MDKKSPFLAQFLARMSAFERENSTFLLVSHPVSADVIFWECTRNAGDSDTGNGIDEMSEP
uniref:Uncharacterized protein n=1 Tax=Candidatus Kentrum sp. FM TaxID=2126340 RepID=A0A450SQ08_9GAMM|nr:MAG: hypothetical protein BECKFM1743A_GA0114220_101595 [Candidatus Kentron sp. FM]VFJ56419.1 MAG: hypothetical protein BECKFM1743C_GA0114222_101765 [Candidatus Kentron sp. FM]